MMSTLQGWEGGPFKTDASGFRYLCELLHYGGHDVTVKMVDRRGNLGWNDKPEHHSMWRWSGVERSVVFHRHLTSV
jgi:hypothetical protein